MSYEYAPAAKGPEVLLRNFEKSRINEADGAFSDLYVDHQADLETVYKCDAKYNGNTPEAQLGKVAEALVFSTLVNHESREFLEFRPTSKYDDYVHGADLLVEPRNARVQSLASIDITINQKDIKGVQRQGAEFSDARPVGLEKKLLRARSYTDRLANIDPSHARELFGWINGGGLHEKKTEKNRARFTEVERLFLMKYYKSSDTSDEPEKPGFVIGGPQAVISLDSAYVNKALSGDKKTASTIGDIALLEFMTCIEEEQQYLNGMVSENKSRNIFFDTHFSKVQAWSNVFNRPEMVDIKNKMLKRNIQDEAFREQMFIYADAFSLIKR